MVTSECVGTEEIRLTWIGDGDGPAKIRFRVSSTASHHSTPGGSGSAYTNLYGIKYPSDFAGVPGFVEDGRAIRTIPIDNRKGSLILEKRASATAVGIDAQAISIGVGMSGVPDIRNVLVTRDGGPGFVRQPAPGTQTFVYDVPFSDIVRTYEVPRSLRVPASLEFTTEETNRAEWDLGLSPVFVLHAPIPNHYDVTFWGQAGGGDLTPTHSYEWNSNLQSHAAPESRSQRGTLPRDGFWDVGQFVQRYFRPVYFRGLDQTTGKLRIFYFDNHVGATHDLTLSYRWDDDVIGEAVRRTNLKPAMERIGDPIDEFYDPMDGAPFSPIHFPANVRDSYGWVKHHIDSSEGTGWQEALGARQMVEGGRALANVAADATGLAGLPLLEFFALVLKYGYEAIVDPFANEALQPMVDNVARSEWNANRNTAVWDPPTHYDRPGPNGGGNLENWKWKAGFRPGEHVKVRLWRAYGPSGYENDQVLVHTVSDAFHAAPREFVFRHKDMDSQGGN